MEKKISLSEVYQLAVRNEKNGMLFYEQLELNSQKKEIKSLAAQLKEEEKKHMDLFEQLLKENQSVYSESNLSELLDSEDLVLRYLDQYFPSSLFHIEELESVDLSDDYSVLLHSIKMEKDSISFYCQLKDVETDQSVQRLLDQIIEQEKGHIRGLNEIFRKLP